MQGASADAPAVGVIGIILKGASGRTRAFPLIFRHGSDRLGNHHMNIVDSRRNLGRGVAGAVRGGSRAGLRRYGASVAAALLPIWIAAMAAGGTFEFNRDIRPILSDKCFACHGFDRAARKADLRLDVEASATASREGRTPIVPGRPGQSEVIRRIQSTDPEEVMPPPRTGKVLSVEERRLIEGWIASGGRYEEHWSYGPVRRPGVPTLSSGGAPEIAAGMPAPGPVDAFIDPRLAAVGLLPAGEADRRTLVRRLSFDLHGMPPDPEDVEAFAGSTDPRAYERLVEKFLASPRHAERMTVTWLDLVRYADSIGFHGDCTLSVWPYRDWVLRAFRENMPFDRFTREQLAGDLVPGAGMRERVASGFNRLNRMSTEGGAQDREYLAKYAADRVRTVGSVWMGTTMGCAECHDHKYDPFTMRDFYSMAAFFADLKEKGFYERGFSENDWGPKVLLPSPAQEARLAALTAEIGVIESAMAPSNPADFAGARLAWEEEVMAADRATNLAWRPVPPVGLSSVHGATFTVEKEHWVVVGGANPDREVYSVEVRVPPGRVTAVRVETGSDEQFSGNRIARGGTTFVLTEVVAGVREEGGVRRLAVAHAAANLDGDGFPAVATIDGDAATGWAITSGHSRECQIVFHLAEPWVAGTNAVMTLELRHESVHRRCTIGKFRVSVTGRERPLQDRLTLPENALNAIRKPSQERTEDERRVIEQTWRRVDPVFEEARRRMARLKAERSILLARVPSTLVSESGPPRVIRVLPRGNWMDERGAVVEPAIPASLGRLDTAGRRATRLDLAGWLTSPSNPLTSRVVVNRLWRQFFGVGLSRTLDDAGSQGEWPTHPELLDWLASELLAPAWVAGEAEAGRPPGRWDLRHVIRLIVNSAAYRRSSVPPAGMLERDPSNRWLGRQNRFRVDAEFVRDTALAVSGLLVEQWGGPSVRPFQPDGYWVPLNFPKREYVTDAGANLHRRGLYTHWQRTFLHPSLVAFDAPSREECTANRVVSNTPLQALVLLNDPNFYEAALALAGRALREGGATTEERLRWIWMRVLGRPPGADELAVLRELHEAESGSPPAGRSDAPWGAWVAVSRAVLNLHETITRN